MRVLVLTSNSLRHQYFTKVISENFELCGVIKQPKSKYYKKSIYNSEEVKKHFVNLSKMEKSFFAQKDGYTLANRKIDLFELDNISINDSACVQWAKERGPEVIFLFGTKILSDEWLDSFKHVINLHLGLSPFYRGSATLFWPFVNRQISCVGTTIHLAVKEVDAGPILKRIKPKLIKGDDYYTINYKAIKAGIDAVPRVASEYFENLIEPVSQINMQKGGFYSKNDFNEKVLIEAFDYIGAGLTDEHIQELSREDLCNC